MQVPVRVPSEGGCVSTVEVPLEQLLDLLQKNLEVALESLEGAQAEMEAKILAERERCTKIAESCATTMSDCCDLTGRVIAERIRQGK